MHLILLRKVLVVLVKHKEVRAFARSFYLHLQLVLTLAEELTEGDWIVWAGEHTLYLSNLILVKFPFTASEAVPTRFLV